MRSDIHLDFPLRGLCCVTAASIRLTACWSKGRSGKYAYYICRNKECADEGKSVKRDTMEDQFAQNTARPAPNPGIILPDQGCNTRLLAGKRPAV